MKNLSLTELRPLIIEWAKERNILFLENAPKQRLKLIEECGELASAVLKNDVKLQKDAIGDIFVVCAILAEQLGVTLSFEKGADNCNSTEYIIYRIIEMCHDTESCEIVDVMDWINDLSLSLGLDFTECANIAYNEIKDRKGKTVNGTFIKN